MPNGDLSSDHLLRDVPVHEGYKVLGGVVLYQKLGQGGMGAVYKGRHLRLDIDVAVKVMALPPGISPSDADNFVKRFIREAKTAAAINHTNLVRVVDVNAEHDINYLVMDYVDGESAGERLKRKGRLSEQEGVEVCLGAAEGLAAAHRKGIVHRDVKPDNIMIDKEGCVRVADLGLAKAFAAEGGPDSPSMLTQTQTAMGTPCYMSPEQFASTRTVGPAADVWSLGVTLYQLLTDTVPWSDSSPYAVAIKVTTEPLPDLSRACPGLSEGARTIIEKALTKEAAGRYANCGEMARALRTHFDSMGGAGTSVLPDAAAGTTKMALMSVSRPASNTMTLIERHLLGKGQRAVSRPVSVESPPARAPGAATPATVLPAPIPVARSRFLPTAIVGVLVLAAVVITVLLLRPAPLESEAAKFYSEQTEAAMAGKNAQVDEAVRRAAGRYDGTTYGERIRQLGETVAVAARIADTKRQAEEKRRLADFEAAKKAADEAEKSRDLEEAARQLKAALDYRDDPELRERLAELERRIEYVRLMAEGNGAMAAGDLHAGASKYELASKASKSAERAKALEKLAEVTARIEVEDAVEAIRKDAEGGRWRQAWDRIELARNAGIPEERLASFARDAVAALAPKEEITGPLGMELLLVDGGTFAMGSTDGGKTEKPVHEVGVSAFYMGRHEVTRVQFEAFRSGRQSVPRGASKTGDMPATGLSWAEAVAFCKYLGGIAGAGSAFRLPTEAEWEFAARGPEGRTYPWGTDTPTPAHANAAGARDGFDGLAPVGSFPKGATPLGLHDMAGNASEWCSDWYDDYQTGAQTDPVGPARGKARVVRGGACEFGPESLRAAARSGRRPDDPSGTIGFRVVRDLTPEERKFHELSKRNHE